MVEKRQLEVRRIGLLVKPKLKAAGAVIERLSHFLSERGVQLVAEQVAQEMAPACRAQFMAREELAALVDLLIVLGGDGTMLAAARLVKDRDTPVLGVNFGGLGYLTEFALDDLIPALQSIFTNEAVVNSRMMLDASVYRNSEPVAEFSVLNDAVVNKSALARIIEIECQVEERYVTTFRADGMIVSTPTGSTAYSLAAGGPIVHPAMSAIIITPICPHKLTNRPLVVPGEARVRLKLKTAREEVTLTLDGQLGFGLEVGDEVIINRSARTFNIVQPSNKNFFQVLRDKLHWGR
jgi:NAD+ kinase